MAKKLVATITMPTQLEGIFNAQSFLGSVPILERRYRRLHTAYAWYNIAAANGNENGKEYKAEMAQEMTKEQIAEAQKLSTEMVEANPKLMGD